jgi:hypothetical protein
MTRSLHYYCAFALVVGCSASPATDQATSEVNDDDDLPLLGGRPPTSELAPAATVADYKIGDEFGKKPVVASALEAATPAFRRAARATARVGGATGFYIGKFAGAHVMATNHHVQPTMSCGGRSVTFPMLGGLRLRCERVLGTWPNIDLSLFVVTVAPADEAKLAEVAANFTFYDDIAQGADLITVGFGIAGNTTRTMMANQDSDCRVMSATADYRLLADPDELNPGTYKAWSFSHACDISHGDSGSAMVDRTSGKPVGIVWTGRIPKSDRVQSSAYLQSLGTDHADVWKELNYAVPATKMREHIATVIAAPNTPSETRTILTAVIAQPR